MLGSGWLGGISGIALGAAGGLITWIGTEISRRVTTVRETRENTARALVELLEIRRYLASFKVIKEQLETLAGGPIPNLLPAFHAFLPQFMVMDWDGLRTRYNTAINALAGLRPVLAYHLRSKDVIGPFLQQLGAAAFENPDIAQAWSLLDKIINTYGLSALTDSVLMLARKHGWLTLREAKKAIKDQDALPSELQTALREWIQEAMKQAAAQQQAQPAATQQPPAAPVTQQRPMTQAAAAAQAGQNKTIRAAAQTPGSPGGQPKPLQNISRP